LAICNPSGLNASRLLGLNNGGCEYYFSDEEIQTIVPSSTFTPEPQIITARITVSRHTQHAGISIANLFVNHSLVSHFD
jgi:16S rRNA A1518/A1519 N6-dimethyltransferase RsmA/KsgA/DIM1 with predicted DNA glycosylase/AP lyase activity